MFPSSGWLTTISLFMSMMTTIATTEEIKKYHQLVFCTCPPHNWLAALLVRGRPRNVCPPPSIQPLTLVA